MNQLPGGRRTAVHLVVLGLYVVVGLVGAVVALWALVQASTGTPLEDRELSMGLWLLTLAVHLLLICLEGIVFLAWLHQTYANAEQMGATRWSPIWVTVSILIPFYNLVMPYRAIQEIWRASESRPGVSPRNSALILGWWLLFLVWQGVWFMTIDKMPEDSVPTRGWWVAILTAEIVGTLAAALAFIMVMSIRQRQKNHGIGSTAPTAPPSPLSYPLS